MVDGIFFGSNFFSAAPFYFPFYYFSKMNRTFGEKAKRNGFCPFLLSSLACLLDVPYFRCFGIASLHAATGCDPLLDSTTVRIRSKPNHNEIANHRKCNDFNYS